VTSELRIRVVYPDYTVKAPSVGHSLELVIAGVFENDSRTGGEVFDGRGHQDLG
jgi:hypothetical protein